MRKDLFELVQDAPIKSIDSAAVTDTVAGASADLKGFHSAVGILDVDAWTDGAHLCRLQESDDNSTFTDVAAADLIFIEAGAVGSDGQITIDGAADDDQAYVIGYTGAKRYIRWCITETAASTGAIIGGLLVRGHKANRGKLTN